MTKKIIDIANSLEFINDFNNVGISGNSARISTSDRGEMFLYSPTVSSNSTSGTIVLHNGGLGIDCTNDSNSTTSGGALTIAGGVSINKSLFIGGVINSSNINGSNASFTNVSSNNIYINGDIYKNGLIYTSSEWKNTMGNIFYTSGNVGIGTVSPVYTLDVYGSANFSSSITTNSLSATNSKFTNSTLGTINVTGITASNINFTGSLYKNGSIYINWTSNTTSNSLFYTSGNVGIGTSNPNSSLDISGNLNVSNSSSLNIVSSNKNGNVLEISNKSNTGSSSIQFSDNSGIVKLTSGYNNNGSGSLAGYSFLSSSTSVSLQFISGNLINNPVILNANDNSMSILCSTDASDIYSGALKVSGGASIENKLYVGDDLHVQRDLYVSGSINGMAGSSSSYSYITLSATDDSVNLSTGALISFGGITIQNTANALNISNGGSFLTAGGATIQKSLIVGEEIISNTLTAINIVSSSFNITSTNGNYTLGITDGNVYFKNPLSGYIWYENNTISNMKLTNGNLSVTGDITGFGNLSDVRLKTNITDIAQNESLNVVNALRPVTFDWKKDIFNESKRGTSDAGFIAQEVEQVIPYAVSDYTISDTTYKNIKFERILPYLVGSIQKLTMENSELKNRLNEIEKKL
jgi:hypothetical protein